MTLNNENNNECCKCTTPEIYIELNQQGPQGRQGNPGVDGVSPEVTVAQNTNTSYVLKIEDANGSFTTPNLKANLPLGGVDGQMLVKLSNEDGVVGWEGDIDNLVTLDGEQEITGNKTFSNNTVFNNYIQTQLLDGEDDTPTTIIGVENYHQNVDNPPALMFGNPEHNTLLGGTTLEAKVGDDYYSLLHQGNVTAGDNVTITPTDNGIQIASTTEPYTLPIATATTLGGIKVGENLSITEDGVLNAIGSAPANMVTTDTPQDITANKSFKSGTLLFYNENKPKIAINNMPASISLSYEGNISDDSSQILKDTNSDWRVGRYNKQGIISSSTPLQRMGAGPYFNLYPILDSSNLGSYVDGTTITYTDGKLKASGGSVPSNMVTTDTAQTITGVKTFTAKDINFNYDITFRENNNSKDVLNLSTSSVTIPGNVSLQLENGSLYLNSSNTSTQVIINKNNDTYGLCFSVNGDVYFLGPVDPDYSSAKQIVTTKDIGNLKYWTGTEEAYTGLAAKDADTLYRTTDTNKVFLGTIQLGG